MSFNYAQSQATAERLIARFGQSASLRRVAVSGGTAYDPNAGTATTTDYAVTIVSMAYSNYEIDGTLIFASDLKLYLSTDGLSVTPLQSDKIVIGSDVYAIVSIKSFNPAGTVIYYEIQARK